MRVACLALLLIALAFPARADDADEAVTISRPLMVKLLDSNKRLREQLEKAYEDADKASRERDTCFDSRTT